MFEKSEENSMPDNIEYKQLVTQDRTEMMTTVKPHTKCIKILIVKLEYIKIHNFIAK